MTIPAAMNMKRKFGGKTLIEMPKLYLVPNTISETSINLLPDYIAREIKDVRVFFVEEPKSGRRLLKSIDAQFPLSDCRFFDLNEHTNPKQIQEYAKLLKEGNSAVISEAGCPCVADPGADLVFLAHQNQIEIVPLVGPSSILLALMASGLNGQNFAFNGYLPKDKQERIQKIKMLEERSHKEKQAQIFMEAPYRNQSILEDILAVAQDKTFLCIACGITGPHQIIKTMSVKEWKKTPLNFDKKPALFLLQKL
jgi:16S rRNA (cytidine1402-2'-O)-methyltransferase